jgi:hypothetical protein
MTRPLHPSITACGHRVRFAETWREEFFEAPLSLAPREVLAALFNKLFRFPSSRRQRRSSLASHAFAIKSPGAAGAFYCLGGQRGGSLINVEPRRSLTDIRMDRPVPWRPLPSTKRGADCSADKTSSLESWRGPGSFANRSRCRSR